MLKMIPTIAAGLLFAGTALAASSGAVQVTGAWARATPGGAENGAAYVTLTAPNGDRLTGLSTPVANKAELHSMRLEGSVMKMRQVATIDLPAGQKVSLQPGHFHIMLVGLKQKLQAGQSFPLTLHFAKSGDEQITVPVEKIGAMGPHDQGGAAQGAAMNMPMPAHR